jgi:DNA-binding IclR family transcriptional regulator
MSEKSAAPALDRGLSILELAMTKSEGCTFGEISKALALSPASTNRFLKVLVARGYLMKKTGSTSYVLGQAVDRLAGKASLADIYIEEGAVFLERLCNEFEETSALFLWENRQWKSVGRVLHEHSVVMQAVGEVRGDILNYPWSAFAWNTMPKAERKRHLEGYARRKQLKKQLDKEWQMYETLGYIHTEEQIHRITAPVMQDRVGLVGAMAVGLSGGPLKQATIQLIGQRVSACAAQLSTILNAR